MANVEKLERKGGVNGAESIEVYTRRKAKDVEYGVKTFGSQDRTKRRSGFYQKQKVKRSKGDGMSVKEQRRGVKNRDKRGKDKCTYTKRDALTVFDRLTSKAIPHFPVFRGLAANPQKG